MFYYVEPQKVQSKLRAMLPVSEDLSVHQKSTIPTWLAQLCHPIAQGCGAVDDSRVS
jgi:hypothetical protein